MDRDNAGRVVLRLVSLVAAVVLVSLGSAAVPASATPARTVAQMHMFPPDPPVIRG
jgi:hypothetical protein